MKFSVLIAAYNAAQFLPECFDSLLAQTDGDFEALCVDDASTDATWEVMQRYAHADRRFRPLRQAQNQGQAVARNRALAEATGEWIVMLDADDFLSSDALQKLRTQAEAHPRADALVLDLVKFFPEEGGREERYAWPKGAPDVLDGRTACVLSIDWRLHGVCAVRRALHAAFPFDESRRSFSDDNTARRHYLHSREVVRTDATYHYRQHAQSCTHAAGASRLDFLAALLALRAFVREAKLPLRARRRCETMCWRNFIATLLLYIKASRESVKVSDAAASHPSALPDELRTFFAALNPLLIAPSALFRPSTLYLRPFGLLVRYQRFFTTVLRPLK